MIELKHVGLAHASDYSKSLESYLMTPQQKYDAAILGVSDLPRSAHRIAHSEAYGSFYETLKADMGDISSWVAYRHGLDDVWLCIEYHLSRERMCDLSICNAPYVEPRSVRVTVRDDATQAFQALGYRFDLISGFDIDYHTLSAAHIGMSAHQKLKAIGRIDRVVRAIQGASSDLK